MSKPIVMERVLNTAMPIRWPLSRLKTWQQARSPAAQAGMDENQASSGLSRIQGIKAAMRKNGLHSVCEKPPALTWRNASTTAQQRL